MRRLLLLHLRSGRSGSQLHRHSLLHVSKACRHGTIDCRVWCDAEVLLMMLLLCCLHRNLYQTNKQKVNKVKLTK